MEQLNRMRDAFHKTFNPLPATINEVFDTLIFRDGLNVEQVNRMRGAFNVIFNPDVPFTTVSDSLENLGAEVRKQTIKMLNGEKVSDKLIKQLEQQLQNDLAA